MRGYVHRLWGWWRALGSRRAQLTAWVVLGALVAVLLARSESAADRANQAALDAHTALEAFETTETRDDARQCVGAWETRTGVLSLIEGLVAASPDADPARVAAFREDMNRRLPDPVCDLDRARRVLGDE